jgi:hypothetical protein
MIDVRQSDGYVAVGTHGNGVFTTTLYPSSVPDEESRSAHLMLEGNAPNPVRTATEISFTLGSPAPVRLALFDVAGREVRRMLDGRPFEAGRHSVRLDLRDQQSAALPSGIYYYTIEAAGERRTGSMVVAP